MIPLTMIPVRSQWGRYNLPRFINIQVSVRADYQWQSENCHGSYIDATRGHNPKPWWHQNSPGSRGSTSNPMSYGRLKSPFGVRTKQPRVFWQFQSHHPRLKLAVRWLFDSRIWDDMSISPIHFHRGYPLVNIQKTMENHNFSWVNQL